MSTEVCCCPYGKLFAEKFKAKINTNIFRFKTFYSWFIFRKKCAYIQY